MEDQASRQIEEAEQTLYDLATTGEFSSGFQTFKSSVVSAIEMAEVAHKHDGKFSGVATGLKDVDTMIGGLHPSDLIIIAGRPSMGKTALATNIAFNAAYDYQYETDDAGNKMTVDGLSLIHI